MKAIKIILQRESESSMQSSFNEEQHGIENKSRKSESSLQSYFKEQQHVIERVKTYFKSVH